MPDPSAYDERFENWPQVPVDGWPALLEEFLTHLHALTHVAQGGTGPGPRVVPCH